MYLGCTLNVLDESKRRLNGINKIGELVRTTVIEIQMLGLSVRQLE